MNEDETKISYYIYGTMMKWNYF